MSQEFVSVAAVADVAPDSAVCVTVDGRDIGIFHVDGNFYAIDNTCPHQGGPLNEGFIEGTRVTCPWHSWCFNLTDGTMTLGDFDAIDTFDVRIDGGTIGVARAPRPRAEGAA